MVFDLRLLQGPPTLFALWYGVIAINRIQRCFTNNSGDETVVVQINLNEINISKQNTEVLDDKTRLGFKCVSINQSADNVALKTSCKIIKNVRQYHNIGVSQRKEIDLYPRNLRDINYYYAGQSNVPIIELKTLSSTSISNQNFFNTTPAENSKNIVKSSKIHVKPRKYSESSKNIVTAKKSSKLPQTFQVQNSFKDDTELIEQNVEVEETSLNDNVILHELKDIPQCDSDTSTNITQNVTEESDTSEDEPNSTENLFYYDRAHDFSSTVVIDKNIRQSIVEELLTNNVTTLFNIDDAKNDSYSNFYTQDSDKLNENLVKKKEEQRSKSEDRNKISRIDFESMEKNDKTQKSDELNVRQNQRNSVVGTHQLDKKISEEVDQNSTKSWESLDVSYTSVGTKDSDELNESFNDSRHVIKKITQEMVEDIIEYTKKENTVNLKNGNVGGNSIVNCKDKRPTATNNTNSIQKGHLKTNSSRIPRYNFLKDQSTSGKCINSIGTEIKNGTRDLTNVRKFKKINNYKITRKKDDSIKCKTNNMEPSKRDDISDKNYKTIKKGKELVLKSNNLIREDIKSSTNEHNLLHELKDKTSSIKDFKCSNYMAKCLMEDYKDCLNDDNKKYSSNNLGEESADLKIHHDKLLKTRSENSFIQEINCSKKECNFADKKCNEEISKDENDKLVLHANEDLISCLAPQDILNGNLNIEEIEDMKIISSNHKTLEIHENSSEELVPCSIMTELLTQYNNISLKDCIIENYVPEENLGNKASTSLIITNQENSDSKELSLDDDLIPCTIMTEYIANCTSLKDFIIENYVPEENFEISIINNDSKELSINENLIPCNTPTEYTTNYISPKDFITKNYVPEVNLETRTSISIITDQENNESSLDEPNCSKYQYIAKKFEVTITDNIDTENSEFMSGIIDDIIFHMEFRDIGVKTPIREEDKHKVKKKEYLVFELNPTVNHPKLEVDENKLFFGNLNSFHRHTNEKPFKEEEIRDDQSESKDEESEDKFTEVNLSRPKDRNKNNSETPEDLYKELIIDFEDRYITQTNIGNFVNIEDRYETSNDNIETNYYSASGDDNKASSSRARYSLVERFNKIWSLPSIPELTENQHITIDKVYKSNHEFVCNQCRDVEHTELQNEEFLDRIEESLKNCIEKAENEDKPMKESLTFENLEEKSWKSYLWDSWNWRRPSK